MPDNLQTSIHPITTFIYKVASRCNLDCSYCYEYNMGDNSWKDQPHFTSRDTAKKLTTRVREHAETHNLDYVMFSFHGGEPLLAGPLFFRDLVHIIREGLGEKIRCSFGIQTNGTLITEEVVRIFNEEEISIGLSLDGPMSAHDEFRIYANKKGSFNDVMKGVKNLMTPEGKKIFRGILAVINLKSNPIEVLDFFATLAPPTVDFLLPHGNWTIPPPGKTFARDNTPYADWLIKLFDQWFNGRHWEISIRTFEEIIGYKLGGKGRLETLGLSPVSLICVAPDGSIEGVDTLKSVFPGAHKLGLHIVNNSFDDALNHHMLHLRQIGLDALSDTCIKCPVVNTCGGGYFPHRWSREEGFKNPSVYCMDLLKLINHIHGEVQKIHRVA